jgi:tRNA threonylcarbamoyladenosine biosynthesis protein TsaB
MSLILNIDTASEKAHVSFAKDGLVLHALYSDSQKEHASFLQTAILQLSKISGIKLSDLDAIAVTGGPGSYTGLRVGMASAKGLCYALNKPFIIMSTLEILTVSALQVSPPAGKSVLFCPMIDARRMEVFTAIYKNDLTPYLPPCAMILNESTFENELSDNKILFFGSGSEKWISVCKHANAVFENVILMPEAMSLSSNKLYCQKLFSDLAYSEPFYLKDFQIVTS